MTAKTVGAPLPRTAAIADLRARLLRWYRKSHRDLPWRRTRDPYAIWVSEIMLQQTRVETVVPYYHRFLARFPDAAALAGAPLDDVLTLWSGLGYYRRARMLHATAGLLLRDHAGAFPRDVAAARELPGIGRSTAGAIVSIGYGARAPVLDGNVKRVLARVFACRGDPDARPLEPRLWELAQAFVDSTAAGDVNQALMELGATTCLPGASARCDECPWSRSCAARAGNLVAALPDKSRRTTLREETWAVAIAQRAGRYLIRRRGDRGLLRGMYEFPTTDAVAAPDQGDAGCRTALRELLQAELGATATVGAELGHHRQVISSRRVTQRLFVTIMHRTSVRSPASGSACWLTPDEIRARAITTATRKILARLETASCNG